MTIKEGLVNPTLNIEAIEAELNGGEIHPKTTPHYKLTHKIAKEELGRLGVMECEYCGMRRVCYQWEEQACLHCIRVWEEEVYTIW